MAQRRGIWASVVRAIEIVERALEKYEAPIYVRHEVVHSGYVAENLKTKGARFAESLAEVPQGARTIFSAHGVARGRGRGLSVIAILPGVEEEIEFRLLAELLDA